MAEFSKSVYKITIYYKHNEEKIARRSGDTEKLTNVEILGRFWKLKKMSGQNCSIQIADGKNNKSEDFNIRKGSLHGLDSQRIDIKFKLKEQVYFESMKILGLNKTRHTLS